MDGWGLNVAGKKKEKKRVFGGGGFESNLKSMMGRLERSEVENGGWFERIF